jgi:hypothetical protein
MIRLFVTIGFRIKSKELKVKAKGFKLKKNAPLGAAGIFLILIKLSNKLTSSPDKLNNVIA